MAKGKEAVEALDAVFALALHVMVELKDGFQVKDLAVLLAAAASDPVVLAGLQGVSDVPKEFSEHPAEVAFDLVKSSVAFAEKVVKLYV